MKTGDFVKKILGSRHHNREGIVIKCFNTIQGYPIVEVWSNGEILRWASHLLEVIHENQISPK